MENVKLKKHVVTLFKKLWQKKLGKVKCSSCGGKGCLSVKALGWQKENKMAERNPEVIKEILSFLEDVSKAIGEK